jgi:hypothetical protein
VAAAFDSEHPQRVLDLVPSPQRTFDNFVVGDNAELVARLRAGAADGNADRFIYLWGAAGSGRTHLLRAAIDAGAGAAALPGRYMDLRAPDGPLGIELLADQGGRRLARVVLDNVDAIDTGGQQRLFNLYNTLRAEIGLGRFRSFDEMTADPAVVALLREAYGVHVDGTDRVEDVDLLVGTLCEAFRPTGFGFGDGF